MVHIVLFLLQSCNSIISDAEGITPDDDIRVACETYGTGPNQPEQLLYDCYVRVSYSWPNRGGEYFNILYHHVTAGTRFKQFYGQRKTKIKFITQDS